MPLFIDLPRKTKKDKRCYLNLNAYRNWHHITSNQVKHAYAEIAFPKLEGLKIDSPVMLTFTLFTPTSRRIDRANPLCIHEKFFCDAMVTAGVIVDDCDDDIHSSHYYSGGKDAVNPRVDILLEWDLEIKL